MCQITRTYFELPSFDVNQSSKFFTPDNNTINLVKFTYNTTRGGVKVTLIGDAALHPAFHSVMPYLHVSGRCSVL